MSHQGGRARTRRPETARPRREARDEPAPPPSAEDLLAIERQLVTLTELLGATATPDPDGAAVLVRWPGHGAAFNHAALVRWSEDDWRERVSALADRLRPAGEPAAVVVAEGLTEPADLAARLERLGWVTAASESVMWTRRAGVVPHLDPGMRIEAVTAASAREYETVERMIFGLSPLEAAERLRALTASIEEGRQRAYLVRLAGQSIATARLAVGDGVAGLHGIGVVEGWRRRGVGTLITTVATRAGLAMGRGLVWLSVANANEGARRLYEGLDYRPAFTWRLMVDARR